ncbi:MAG: GNAT family N-acetyltransferase [Candidatus Buchananbacteria bacterium]
MPEQPKQFDFSKPEDREEFDALDQEEKKKNAEASKEGAYAINDLIKEKKAKNYDEAMQAVKKEFIRYLHNMPDDIANIDRAIKVKKKINLSEEFISSPQVQEAIMYGLTECIFNADLIDTAIKAKEEFNVPEEIFQEAVMQGLIKNTINHHYNYAIKIKEIFNLPEEIIQEATKKEVIKCFSYGKIKKANAIKDEFKINISYEEIVQHFPRLENLIEKISEFAPEFRAQVEKSSDLVIGLCGFINNPDELLNAIEENPHLIDALTNNTRFSSRLLVKYPQFDENSKENIEILYSTKKKIIADNPGMNPESLEFRQLMQEGLKEYKDNPEIMAAIKKKGIDLNEWLNYSETSYFNLSTGGSEIAFSEKIRTPIDRIKETIDSYAYTIKSVLKEYRPEMEKFEIVLEDAKSIEDQIAKMEAALEQARAEGNEKKAQGIERGLASQKEKLNNLKKGFLWDKLMGEIAAFQRLKNDCFDAQNKLLEAENKLDEALSGKMPSGKMIQDIKQQITQSKEELRNKFSDLEKRIEDFKIELPELISPCLGAERSDALMQEIDQKMAEQFNHFDSDRTDLANLFSERGDKETSQLESRPMSIFVWARNPDVDLYQGNYSPCCICIDSAHMGAESTIADYNTDLGVQIVNIWDETKNEPVTAAWCWLGKSENGETALVVDNIESNTLYSSNFSEQLTKELFDYIKEYAQKIGVKKVVLGKANNDLPTGSELAKMNDDRNKYDKIGGANRADGYFLEAEDKSVKLVWERTEKKTEKRLKIEKRIEKVVFNNLATTTINKNNLNQILQAERKIYAGTDLISDQTMAEDIKRGNDFEYSIAINGIRPNKKSAEIVAYIVGVEDETDEGDPSIYMEDIAVLPEAQRQGIGWEAMKEFIGKLKVKAQKDNKPVLLDMHLRETSQAFMDRHKEDLESLGVKLIEEALVPDYYDEGEDALYQIYEIK